MSESTKRARVRATHLLRDLWHRRHSIWEPAPCSPDDIFPLDMRLIAEKGLGVRFEEPEEIQVPAHGPRNSVPVQTAGFIDRERNRIVVAQRFSHEYRRFTGAHEVAHWLLHPDFTYHRDRPLKGNERLMPKRPQVELEADAFAAELLMPSKYLRRCYLERYGDVLKISTLDERAVFWLSGGNPSGKRPPNVSSRGRRHLSMRIATCASFDNHHFVPLGSRFGVSPTTMAIRLEELQLVVG